jgi:hypothetical protein
MYGVSPSVRRVGDMAGPADVGLGPVLVATFAADPVVYRFSGTPTSRGLFRFVAATKVRSSPRIRSDNVVRTAAKNSTFSGRQSAQGTSVGGSTLWHGNAAGDEWIPDASVTVIGHNVSVTISLRKMLDGPNVGLYLPATVPYTVSGDADSGIIQRVYPFEEPLIGRWDPRRDGIGVEIGRESIDYGAVTTRKRWGFASYSAGAYETTLDVGISAAATTFLLASEFGAPPTPFTAVIGDAGSGTGEEKVQVTEMVGAMATVTRGFAGSTAIVHEKGERFALVDPPEWNGLVFDYDWPAGDAWALAQLARLNHVGKMLNIEVEAETPVVLGSRSLVTLNTEGPWPDSTQLYRVTGWARDPFADSNGIVLEDEPA